MPFWGLSMSLKKEEVEKELFIHFSKKEIEGCKIEICDIDQISGCIEKFKEEKNCCYLSKDSFYILYFNPSFQFQKVK